MKPEKRILDFESNLSESGAERVAMSIDESSLAHVMAVLTDLYSDTEAAVIREYSTNARDANTEAGSAEPVRFTTPTALAPFVRITDNGVGLSAEDIRDTFSKYGSSTKRDSDDVVGMLGLGCKSALTYADSFTVASTKDGRTISVLVTRDEDGSGSMSIVSDEDTPDAPNGTEIIVPAKSGNTFAQKAAKFFRYWPDGSVLVDGKAPERVDGLRLSERILLAPREYGETDVIVMGGVPYPFLSDVDSPNYNGRRIVAFVDIGEVSFVPSREALQSTKRTRERLAAIVAEVHRELVAAVSKSITDAKTPAEAKSALREGLALGVKDARSLKYDGREILLTSNREPKTADGSPSYADARDSLSSFLHFGGGYRPRVTGERSWKLETDVDCLVFENFDAKLLSPTKRDKLALWGETNGRDVTRAVFVDKLSALERYWLAAEVRDWSEVSALKLPKYASADGTSYSKPRGSYLVSVDGAYCADTLADAIDRKRPLYWTQGNAYSVSEHPAIRYGAVDTSRASVVALPANRVDKFVRDFPEAVELHEAAKRNAAAWLAKLSPLVLRAYAFEQSGEARILRGLRAEPFADSKLRDAITLANVDTKSLTDRLRAFGAYVSLPSAPKDLPREVLADYPLVLLDRYASLTKVSGDMILYCNSKFAELRRSAKTAATIADVDGAANGSRRES